MGKAKDLCWDIDDLNREIREAVKALTAAEVILRKIKASAEEMARQVEG